jgi:hypothetical protein
MKSFPGGAKPVILFAFVVVGIKILVLSFVGSKAWGSVYFTPPDPNSVRIRCAGRAVCFLLPLSGN